MTTLNAEATAVKITPQARDKAVSGLWLSALTRDERAAVRAALWAACPEKNPGRKVRPSIRKAKRLRGDGFLITGKVATGPNDAGNSLKIFVPRRDQAERIVALYKADAGDDAIDAVVMERWDAADEQLVILEDQPESDDSDDNLATLVITFHALPSPVVQVDTSRMGGRATMGQLWSIGRKRLAREQAAARARAEERADLILRLDAADERLAILDPEEWARELELDRQAEARESGQSRSLVVLPTTAPAVGPGEPQAASRAFAVRIGGRTYSCSPYPRHGDGLRSYAVEHLEASYDVAELADGRISCTCGDWQNRRAGLPGLSLCKHAKALADLGLVVGRCPTPEPAAYGAVHNRDNDGQVFEPAPPIAPAFRAAWILAAQLPPLCGGSADSATTEAPAPEPVAEVAPEPINTDRDAVIARIKAALKRRSGKTWSVTGGSGTAWGWIEINVPPARRTWQDVQTTTPEPPAPGAVYRGMGSITPYYRVEAGADGPIRSPADDPWAREAVEKGHAQAYNWEVESPGEKYGHASPAERIELGQLLGLGRAIHYQGHSIAASLGHRSEYVDRAEGREPTECGEQYWD